MHQRVWIGIEEMSVARGLHVIELLWRRRRACGLHVTPRISLGRTKGSWSGSEGYNSYFAVWLEWVEGVGRLRGERLTTCCCKRLGDETLGRMRAARPSLRTGTTARF